MRVSLPRSLVRNPHRLSFLLNELNREVFRKYFGRMMRQKASTSWKMKSFPLSSHEMIQEYSGLSKTSMSWEIDEIDERDEKCMHMISQTRSYETYPLWKRQMNIFRWLLPPSAPGWWFSIHDCRLKGPTSGSLFSDESCTFLYVQKSPEDSKEGSRSL